MRFNIITIFPKIFASYLNASLFKRARVRKLVDIRVHDLRKFSHDRHKKVDDRPYGGGPGMVLKTEPIVRAIDAVLRLKTKNPRSRAGALRGRQKSKVKVILFSAGSKQFDAKMGREWVKKYDRVVMIAGHYEGVDGRLKSVLKNIAHRRPQIAFEELSVGPYVLTGGELPALIVVDAVSRHIPGFLGKEESLEENRYGVGVPVFTRPEVFVWPQGRGVKGKKYKVPKVLLSGVHKKIDDWRRARGKVGRVRTFGL